MTLPPLVTSSDWQLRLRHRSAGRARLQLPVLRREPELADRLSAALEVDPLIRAVRLNPRCASLVVHHALDHCSDTALVAQLMKRLEPLSLAWRVSQLQAVVNRIGPDSAFGSASASGSASAAEDMHQCREAVAQKPIAAQANCASRSRRPGLTWALADVPIRPNALAGDPLPSLQQKPLSAVRSQQPSRRPSCWLCALHRRFMRWMTRLTLRCWWQGR
ncbi:hypothetical protein CCR96_11815 [Halochromatium roseum]|nr:hypothetical protein [Halochromatium roseum]